MAGSACAGRRLVCWRAVEVAGKL